MIRNICIYIIIIFLLFFSFNLNGNAQSYIIKEYNEFDINSYCKKNEEVNFSCGELKRIESCEAIEVEVGTCEGTASDEYCIRTYIFVYEIGYFEFGHISSVYAGQGFNFPNVSYKRTAYWDYYRDYEKIILLEARRGLKSSNINLTEVEINTYKSYLDTVANTAFKKYLSDTSGIITSIQVKANDSNKYEDNKSNKNEKLVLVKGSWKKTSETFPINMQEGELNSVFQKYTYNFCKGYINLSGSNFSNVEYKCGDVTLGDNYSDGYNKYYVPFLYPDDDEAFKFNIVNSNSDGYLNINGTCEIDVVNELFECNGSDCDPKYYYRPISLINPFPDGKVSANWKNYNITYKTRLENTYDNGFYYKVVLVENNSKSDELAMDNIEYSNYNDWTNMNADGTSNFLSGSYFKKNNGNSYCEIGSFDNTNCDVHRLGSDGS